MAAHDDLSLMALPLELRQSIWAFALKHTTSMRPCLGLNGRYTRLSRIVTVMCVSKQVYAETITIFYAVNRFSFCWHFVADNFIRGLPFETDLEASKMKTCFPLIQNVMIVQHLLDIGEIYNTYWPYCSTGFGNITMLNVFEHLRRESRHLKSLTLWMSYEEDFHESLADEDDWDKRWTYMHGLQTLVGILEQLTYDKPAILIEIVLNEQTCRAINDQPDLNGGFVRRLAMERGCYDTSLYEVVIISPYLDKTSLNSLRPIWTFGYTEWKEEKVDPSREDIHSSAAKLWRFDIGKSDPSTSKFVVVLVIGKVFKLKGRYAVVWEITRSAPGRVH